LLGLEVVRWWQGVGTTSTLPLLLALKERLAETLRR
jgi:hypothetical protein